MNRIHTAMLAALLLAGQAGIVRAAEGRLEATSSALATISQGDWNAGLRYQRDRREFKLSGDEVLPLDIDHLLLRVGTAPLPFLSVWGEIGVSTAEAEREDGDSGMEWGVGGYARLLDLPIETSPVVGQVQAISLGVELSYSKAVSDFEENDLNWTELRVSPLASYTYDQRGEARWFFYGPEAVALRAGPVFVSNDGDYGDEDPVGENSAFGGRIAFDLLWQGGWVTRFDGVFLGSDERQLSFGIGKNF